jgi:hypothetical protein
MTRKGEAVQSDLLVSGHDFSHAENWGKKMGL